MWVKATDLDGQPVWLNMLQARMIVPREDGGSTVMFDPEADIVDVREEPEVLVRGEPRWLKTDGVGFIQRGSNDTGRSSPAEFESSLVGLMNAQREVLVAARLRWKGEA